MSFFLHVSEGSSGEGQEEEGREEKEVGSSEGGKEDTVKVEGRVTALQNISKKTAKRMLELMSKELVRDDVACALVREQPCRSLLAPACSGSLLSSMSWGEGFCMALPCYTKQCCCQRAAPGAERGSPVAVPEPPGPAQLHTAWLLPTLPAQLASTEMAWL